MQIGIIEMPAENTWRVQLDGEVVPGYMKKNNHNERWVVHINKDGRPDRLRTEPHSREGATCLLLFHHFEQERRHLKEAAAAEDQAERARAEAAVSEVPHGDS
jgi:hypothetical protein